MGNDSFLDVNHVIARIGECDGVSYRLVPRKKVLYWATLPDGITKCIFVPRSRYYASIDGYWVDITSVQKSLLDDYGCACVIFRLEGMKYSAVDWKEISPLLTTACIQNNSREGDHWKIYIRRGFLTVRQGEKIPIHIEQV